jgi:hypothetical protein
MGSRIPVRVPETDLMPRSRAAVSACRQISDRRDPGRPGSDSDRCELFSEDIRQRAYEISLARRGTPGDPRADWFQAETELLARRVLGRK